MRVLRGMSGIAGAGALTLVVAACGAGGSDSGAADEQSGGGTGKPAAATALSVESTARKATWTFQGKAHQLKIAPTRLARGTAADLARVQLDDDIKGKVPYYLTVSYTNTGSSALRQPTPESNLTVTLSDGVPGKAISLWNANPLATESGSGLPDDCDKAGPATLAAGATAKVCQLVLLPKGHEPATLAYADDSGDTLLWKIGNGKGDDNAGSLLPAGTTGDSTWNGVGNSHEVPIRVTPKSVRAGSLTDLGDYDLSGDQKNLVPYYVTIAYRNTGTERLLPVMDDGVGVRSAAGREVEPLSLVDFSASAKGEGIDQCRGSVPNTRLEPKSTLTLCTIHLIPKGDRPAMVSFEGEGKGAKPLMWRASR